MTTITKGRIQSSRAELCVARTGIRFHNLAPDRVRIAIEVENRGRGRSGPTPLRVESALFGAFLPWRPLTTLLVPPIPPGRSRIVETIVRQPRPAPIAGFSGLVPRGLLTAAGAGEADRKRKTVTQALTAADQFIGNLLRFLGKTSTCELAPDLRDLLGEALPHWAGNLNVWIGDQAVERHAAPHLRVYAGRPNLAMFLLGHRPDEYAFHMEGTGASWRHTLYDITDNHTVECEPDSRSSPRWRPMSSMRPMLLAVRPPEFCGRGSLEVHVAQRSSGKTAVVEFDLDPTADGPGCFTV